MSSLAYFGFGSRGEQSWLCCIMARFYLQEIIVKHQALVTMRVEEREGVTRREK